MWLLSWSTSVWGADYRQIRLNLHLLIRFGCAWGCLPREFPLSPRYTYALPYGRKKTMVVTNDAG